MAKTDKTINTIDPVAANYMFKKWLHKNVAYYKEHAKKYIALTKDLLQKLVSYAEEKNIDPTDSQFLFLDRDAIIFQYIGKQLCEKYGLTPAQFRSLLSPNDLENKIRTENDEVFTAIYHGMPVATEKLAPVSIDDELPMAESESFILPASPEKLLSWSIQDFARQNNEQLSIYQTYLQEENFDKKHLIVIDGGIAGTTINISKALLKYFLPEADIHTGLIYGQENTQHYRDFTVHMSNVKATHDFLERRPKFSQRLLSLKKDRQGNIYEKRGPSVFFDPNKHVGDLSFIATALKLDAYTPLSAQAFCIAMQIELGHEKLGHKPSDDIFTRMVKRNREDRHSKRYGL